MQDLIHRFSLLDGYEFEFSTECVRNLEMSGLLLCRLRLVEIADTQLAPRFSKIWLPRNLRLTVYDDNRLLFPSRQMMPERLLLRSEAPLPTHRQTFPLPRPTSATRSFTFGLGARPQALGESQSTLRTCWSRMPRVLLISVRS
jgi:hypothetical protein